MSTTEEPPISLSSFGNLLPANAVTGDEPEEEEEQEVEKTTTIKDNKIDESIASTSILPTTPLPPPTPPKPAEIITITSTSPSGLKTRDFLAKYYLPVSSSSNGPSNGRGPGGEIDLLENYFNPTPSELQTAFAGQVRKRELLVDAPLLTKALRDREAEQKRVVKVDRWPQTRIRIKFSDRSQLESIFASTDSLNAIYEFVKCSLAEEHRKGSFILYQTPPKKEYLKTDPLMKGKSLIDLQFTPSSVFYIKFSDESLNETSTPPLVPELLAAAAEFPIPPPFDPTSVTAPVKSGEPANKSQKLGFGGSSGKVIPKWMQKKTGK